MRYHWGYTARRSSITKSNPWCFPPYFPKASSGTLSFAIRRFYNESLFTGLSMRYLCWPILRRRASNWNFPKRDSAPSQPLALARFFAFDPSLFSPHLKSHRDGSFRSVEAPPRSLAKFIRSYVHTHLSIYLRVCRFAPERVEKFQLFYS